METVFRARLRSVDWSILAPLIFLCIVSGLTMYGLGLNPIDPDPGMVIRQAIYIGIGLAGFFFVSLMNYRLFSVYSKVLYLGGGLLLIGVLLFGVTIRGTTGWIDIGPASFQPVEFAKIALIIFLAKYFADHGRLFFLWRHTLISGAAALLFVGLVLRQPDLGSAIVILGSWFLMLIVVGIPKKHLLIILSVFAAGALIAWFFVLEPYQKDRIYVFMNPQADELGIGYNVRQSVIAVGSGRLFGRGFGLGSQSQLKFLPEPETDFVFAVIAEEFGFIGVVLVVSALFFIIYRLVVIARRTADNFAAFFALGLASLLTVQCFINIGMNIGIAPVTGIPLPFLSAGGSSFLSLCAALGIASSIVSDQRTLHSGT